jgi:electron transfer flavoprotein alpha subunit
VAFEAKPAATFVAAHRTEGDLPDLSTARVVVAGGVSFGSAEKFALVQQLAERLGASSRGDAGGGGRRLRAQRLAGGPDRQDHRAGPLCRHRHFRGAAAPCRYPGAKKIVAINIDPEAPLMKVADLALVGDLNEVVPALIAELDRLGVKP